MREISLSQGQIAHVEHEDFSLLSEPRWCYRAAAPAVSAQYTNIIYRIKNLRPARKEYCS
jgi:hypothetical protein